MCCFLYTELDAKHAQRLSHENFLPYACTYVPDLLECLLLHIYFLSFFTFLCNRMLRIRRPLPIWLFVVFTLVNQLHAT